MCEGTTQPAPERRTLAEVLAEHQVVAWGMTHDSANECACGERVQPAPEDFQWEPGRARRDRAFARHQAAVALAAGAVS